MSRKKSHDLNTWWLKIDNYVMTCSRKWKSFKLPHWSFCNTDNCCLLIYFTLYLSGNLAKGECSLIYYWLWFCLNGCRSTQTSKIPTMSHDTQVRNLHPFIEFFITSIVLLVRRDQKQIISLDSFVNFDFGTVLGNGTDFRTSHEFWFHFWVCGRCELTITIRGTQRQFSLRPFETLF